MHDPLTHASFFSGVAGLDMGLERAGWRTVSFSEIDAYASAVLAERFPGVPNLGDIVELARRHVDDRPAERAEAERRPRRRDAGHGHLAVGDVASGDLGATGSDAAWQHATLWSGGFPCQDLSVAGKRAGFTDGERSVLAFAFLELVDRFRPRWILLENVPGLLSSHAGRDLGALVGRLGELGYWWAYRVLDARLVGGCALHGATAVPQRRRRIFIVASADPDGPEQVLTGPGSGAWDLDQVDPAGAGTGPGARDGAEVVGSIPAGTHGFPASLQEVAQGFFRAVPPVAGSLQAPSSGGWRYDADSAGGGHLVVVGSPEADAARVREADGLAGRVDDQHDLAHEDSYILSRRWQSVSSESPTLRVGPATVDDGGPGDTVPLAVYRKQRRAANDEDDETWVADGVANTLNTFDGAGDVRTTHLVVGAETADEEDPLLPRGLDTHRYRCCGNGVVAPVSEWIGARLRAWVEGGLR